MSTLESENAGYFEINILDYLHAVIARKWIVLICVLLGAFIGREVAVIKGPVYIADAVIAQCESPSASASSLSGLGMLGSMVGAELNSGSSASLDKLAQTLMTRTFRARVIEQNHLVPFLLWKSWDTSHERWKDTTFFPRPAMAYVGALSRLITTEHEKGSSVMSVRIEHADSLAADSLLRAVVRSLDLHIREETRKDVAANCNYLQQQVVAVADPIIRTKLLEKIASEMERGMMANKESFRVIDAPLTTKEFKGALLYPVAGAVASLLLSVVVVILLHALATAVNRARVEDRELLEKIRKEFFRFPYFGRRRS